MSIIKSTRIESIDILRGLVMVIMALDHVRDYFHYGSFFVDPTNLETTTPILFFTRFISHYCAPVFIFLAGTSAYLYGTKKTKKQLSFFLFTRGLWLIVLEIIVNNLIWTFDLTYSFSILQVIWAIGLSMIVLSALIHLSYKTVLLIGILLVVGHNLLDGITMQGSSLTSIFWYILHQRMRLVLSPNLMIAFAYPIIPWIGVISLGYCFGKLYQTNFNALKRKQYLLRFGLGATILFFVIRSINIYGDLIPWTTQKNISYTILSFFNVTKYPPSLAYILITLGPALLFLYAIEHIKNKLTDFFLVFGRVPLMYYFLHVLVIHLVAIIGILMFGGEWSYMILTVDVFTNARLLDYGYSLTVVYLVWIGIVLLLYPISKKYMIYKSKNKDKLWLSYL